MSFARLVRIVLLLPACIASTTLVGCARLSGSVEGTGVEIISGYVVPAEDARRLPPGHPPIDGLRYSLPPGHPVFPPGHPPVPAGPLDCPALEALPGRGDGEALRPQADVPETIST